MRQRIQKELFENSYQQTTQNKETDHTTDKISCISVVTTKLQRCYSFLC